MTKGSIRIGIGYDVHKLKPGRKLILCGEELDYPYGLDGHSDADVAVHALMDAMLGAAAMGDIGHLFPDSDPAYKGADSMKLLAEVCGKLSREGYVLGNADIVIVAQKPKIAPHIQKMRENIAAVTGADVSGISVKATTTEHLGFEGRLEGISAQAAVTLYYNA